MMNGYTIFFWILMLLPILIGCGYAFWKLFIYYYRVIRGEPVYWDRDFWFHPWRHMDYLDRRNYFIGLIIVTFYYTLMSVGLYYSFDYLRESVIMGMGSFLFLCMHSWTGYGLYGCSLDWKGI